MAGELWCPIKWFVSHSSHVVSFLRQSLTLLVILDRTPSSAGFVPTRGITSSSRQAIQKQTWLWTTSGTWHSSPFYYLCPILTKDRLQRQHRRKTGIPLCRRSHWSSLHVVRKQSSFPGRAGSRGVLLPDPGKHKRRHWEIQWLLFEASFVDTWKGATVREWADCLPGQSLDYNLHYAEMI